MILTGLGIALGAALMGGGYAVLRHKPVEEEDPPPIIVDLDGLCTDCRGNIRRKLRPREMCEWCDRIADWQIMETYGYCEEVREAFYKFDRETLRKLRAVQRRDRPWI